ncbi:MAG: allantoinase AllB [Nitrososphaerota archaeon]|nr:allantoinase AllB [Nitrososphaerota archaeon]
MSNCDLLIRNCRVVSASGITERDVAIDRGRILALTSDSSSMSPTAKIDAKGMALLPGLIDSHVHFRDPGMVYKEDFLSGSRGAAAGGTTTVFDMPTTVPIVTSAELFREKVSIVGRRSLVDFGLYGAAGVRNVGEIGKMAREGAIAFKTYTVAPPGDRTKEYEGAFVTEAGQLLQVMEAVAGSGLPHCIHAEDDSVVGYLSGRLKSEGRMDPLAHHDSRPNAAEAVSVYQSIAFSRATGARVHVVHVSTKEAVDVIRAAKAEGLPVTCETCPHYLVFTKQALEKMGSRAKYNPPARSEDDVEALWRGIADGTIDIVVSDHAPHTEEEKRMDIWGAPPGTPGVETRLPVFLAAAERRGLGVQGTVRLMSTKVAEIFGVDGRKGDIRPGMDADVALVDLKARWKVRKEDLQTAAKGTSIFDGMEAVGRVELTLLRGVVIYESGGAFAGPGTGEFIPGPKAVRSSSSP